MQLQTSISTIRKTFKNGSERLALRCGFEMIIDENAYNGRYFIQDGKKWIHNIDALKRQLGTSSDSEVEAYYSCH